MVILQLNSEAELQDVSYANEFDKKSKLHVAIYTHLLLHEFNYVLKEHGSVSDAEL